MYYGKFVKNNPLLNVRIQRSNFKCGPSKYHYKNGDVYNGHAHKEQDLNNSFKASVCNSKKWQRQNVSSNYM